MSDGLELGPMPDELRALLEAERAGPGPASDSEQRVLRRLVGSIGLGAPPWSSSDAPPAPAPVPVPVPSVSVPGVGAAAALSPLARVVGAAAIFATGAVTGAGGYHLVRDHKVVPPAPASGTYDPDRRASAVADPSPPIPEAPVDDAAGGGARATGNGRPPGSRSSPRPKAGVAAPPVEPGDDGLASERRLLEIARSALGRGQGEGALEALRRHARTFPNGLLAEEREGLAVQALVVARQFDEARVRGARFKERYPRSLFSPLVEQALGSIP